MALAVIRVTDRMFYTVDGRFDVCAYNAACNRAIYSPAELVQLDVATEFPDDAPAGADQ